MRKTYYLAYGSNLSEEQMARRCPDAEIVGMAALRDWKLVFRRCATIEPCKGRVVPVLVWKISERDEKNLDMYEGFPKFYDKRKMRLTMTDFDGYHPKRITAMVYIMNDGFPLELPNSRYFGTLEEGYKRFGFNDYLLDLAVRETEEALYEHSK